jgi:GrpB-like predicted nucleotidyltransferase (UPF0157 family)
MEASIRIDPYDPKWPDLFEAERALLARVLEAWLAGPIEHVGSTAVPGLCAKPVIDIMAAVESLDASRPALVRLAEIGYCYAPYRTEVMHWLCKPSPELRTHHLHLVPYRGALWADRIAFRERLREDPGLADEYGRLKRELAETYGTDRESYTEAKGPFVERVLGRRGHDAA